MRWVVFSLFAWIFLFGAVATDQIKRAKKLDGDRVMVVDRILGTEDVIDNANL